MYHNKSEVATIIFNKLLNIKFSEEDEIEEDGVPITKLLSNKQLYQLTLHIMQNLPMTDFEAVLHFHKAFKVKKEDNISVPDFKYARLRFRLILEETLELGFALGLSYTDIYTDIIHLYSDIKNKEPKASISEVLDALTDILFVTYGAIDVLNLKEYQYKAMQKVYHSNMTKLIPQESSTHLEVVKTTINEYKHKNIEVISKDLKNGYTAIMNKESLKILKPTTYIPPKLKELFTK